MLNQGPFMNIAQVIIAGEVVTCPVVDPAAVVSPGGAKITFPGGELDAASFGAGASFMIQPGAGIGWALVNGVLVAPVVTPPAPTQADLIAYSAAARFNHETGGISVGGTQIDTSRDSQNMIANANAYVQASGAASVSYKANSGWVTMDAPTVKAVALAVGAHVQACFALEQTIDAAITAGTITTFAQIDGAAWPT
jgi:hypothetical protein